MTSIPTTITERVPLPAAAPAGPPPAAGMSKTLTPADIVGMLKQRLVWIIVLSFLFGSMGVGLFLLAYFKFPTYKAEGLIECISNQPKPSFVLGEVQMQQDPYTRFVMSQALFIKSFPILSEVLKDNEVRNTKWFQKIPQGEHLSELERTLACDPIRDTNYVQVRMSTRDRGDPHKIVNTVMSVYLTQIKEQASSQFRQELQEYKRELNTVKDQIIKKNDEIKIFRTSLPPGEAADRNRLGQGVLVRQLEEDQKTVGQLELQTAELESLKDIYANPAGMAVTPEDRQQVEQDPRVAQLDQQVFALEQEMNIVLARFGKNHREYQDLMTRRDEALAQLENVRQARLQELLDLKRNQIETTYYNSQHALMKAKERLQMTQAQQADLERKLGDYTMLWSELDLLTETQTRLEEYIREIDRIVTERDAVRVRAAVQASPPRERSFPSLLLLPAVLVLAFAAAVGLSVGLELLDTSVKTPQDVTRHLSLPLLGSVPDINDEEVEIEHPESAVRSAPHAMITEAFRTIRGNLQFSAPPERMRALLVTSPKPEDGRTTVAANLAASLAIGGRRVLLVDANLRRPALHRVYPQIGAEGLTNVLIGESTFAASVHKTDLANLDVVGSGPIPPNPAELLNSENFSRFLADAIAAYDQVIFDSPPVLLASDASVIASQVDGSILVYRAKDNSRGVALRARTLLEHVGAHLFGAVLNAAQVRRGGYFREQLRTFYEYSGEDEERGTRALPGRAAGDAKNGADADDGAEKS